MNHGPRPHVRATGLASLAAAGAFALLGLVAPAGAQVEDGPWSPAPPSQVPISRAAASVVQYPINDRTPLPPRAPLPEVEDDDVAAVLALLKGSFRAEAAGGQPEVHLHLARVDITGTDAAVYVEAARADNPGNPFRQAIYVVAKVDGELRLRVMDFDGRDTFPESIVGLWLYPDRFPAMGLRFLKPVMDLAVTREGSGFTARTKGRVPARKNDIGAWEAESVISVQPGRVTVTDRLFDQQGRPVAGFDGSPRAFAAFAPASKATFVDGCLLILDLIPPAPGAMAIGPDMHAAVTYRGWMTNGRLFADFRRENKGEPIQIKWPSAFITGFGEGIKGMTVGSLRRIVIPPGLGFGDGGDLRWDIPGGAFLTFEIQPVWIDSHENLVRAGTAPQGPGVLPASRKDPGQ